MDGLGKSKTRGETHLRTNLGEKTSLVLCFFSTVYCVHPKSSFVPSFSESLGYLTDNWIINLFCK
jgi:hypothetical protein